MADGIRLELDDAAVSQALGRLAQRDRADAMHAIGAYMLAASQRRIERQVAPDGKPFQRLSPRTAAQRIGRTRRGFDNILRVTGRLYNSMVYSADAASASVGTNLVQAALLHEGGTVKMPARRQTIYQRYNEKTGDITGFVKRGRANLARDVDVGAHEIRVPARPWFGIDEADRAEILRIVADHEKRALPGAVR